MSEKRESPTAFGEVEYETVTCSSCGQEELKDEAQWFVIGDRYKPHRSIYGKNSRVGYYEYHFENGMTDGWACRSCADDGSVGFPVNVSFWERLKWVLTGEI